MPLSYANIQDRIESFLQDSTNATYDTTELGIAIENELKHLSRYSPHIVDVIFQVESRIGVASSTLANNLVDATKDQFVATDDDNEKVVHNITDDTWAVVKTYTDAETLALTKDIFVANEEYEIYNKRCKNKRQIYIGDMPPYLWVESVEYPIGTERNFKVKDDILELDVDDDTIQDSDPTLDPLSELDVLVRFAVPLILSQLTDWAGELAASAVAAATSLSIDGLAASASIEEGEQFNLENMRHTYIIAASALATSAGVATITFYPGLEAAALDNDDITFIKSTLQPNHEDLLERMVCSRAVQSDMIRYIPGINIAGEGTMGRFQQWLNNNPLLSPILIQRELESLANPRMAKILAR